MLWPFLRFCFNRTRRNGVALRRAVKAAMPRAKPRIPKPPTVVQESIINARLSKTKEQF